MTKMSPYEGFLHIKMKLFYPAKTNNLNKTGVGGLGEVVAAEYLREKGYRIVETNFRNSIGRQIGEIDIVAYKKDFLVFIEVKSRVWNENFEILPEENITPSKIRKLQKTIQLYIKLHKLWEKKWRLDAVTVIFDKDLKKTKIRHLPDIFI